METRILSLNEANSMLPLLKSIVIDVMEHWNVILAKREEVDKLKKQAPGSAELKETKVELNSFIDKINGYIKEIENLGCLVEEFKRGIINFPSLYHGRKVFLCWKPDEKEVNHWHELDETFSSRVKIKDPSEFLIEKPKIQRQ